MATRSTLGSARFAALLAAQSCQVNFVLLPCDGLAEVIEHAVQDSSATKVIAACARIIRATGNFYGQKEPENASKPFDTLVLGCTHYFFAAQHIAALVGSGVQLLDTGDAVARQTRSLLGDTSPTQQAGQIEFISTGEPAALSAAANAWLELTADVRTLHI